RFMNVYECSKSHKLLDLDVPVSALYLLAAPSTPAEARKEVIERAETGERLSNKTIARVIEQHRAPIKVRTDVEPRPLRSRSRRSRSRRRHARRQPWWPRTRRLRLVSCQAEFAECRDLLHLRSKPGKCSTICAGSTNLTQV